VADRDIKLTAAETLAEVEAIADTVGTVAVPGPTPEASGGTPIDDALAAVAKIQQEQSAAWASAVAATIPEQKARSVNAVHMLETTEAENSAEIARVYPESGGAGATSV
jgi:hypothetical protein